MKNLRFNSLRFIVPIAMGVILLISMFSVLPAVVFVGASPIWWDDAWVFRKAITIDHTKVAGDLVDFPVLIDIVDADLAFRAKPDGADIAFTDILANKLSHEIEYYDSNTGHLVAWVKVPALSSSEDTTLYMYYDNQDALDQSEPYAVWGSNYVMVQHLEEESGVHYDSTPFDNTGVVSGGVVQGAAGQVDGADAFDGSTGYVTVSHSDVLAGFNSAFTASLWVNLDKLSGRRTLLCKYDSSGNQKGWMVEYRGSEKAFALFASPDGVSYKWWYAQFTPKVKTWYYLAIVWESGQIPAFYIDGQQAPTTLTSTITQIYDNSGTPLNIGKCTYSTTYNFDGILDEIRLSNAIRSPAWILTSYNNQRSASDFYTLGNEDPTVDPPIFDEYPQDGATNVSVSLSQLSFNLSDAEGDLMDFTVVTAPDVGSSFGVNAGNGRYNVPISGLVYSTVYTWNVSVTDGISWTNKTYTFTTETLLQLKWMVQDWNGYGGVIATDVTGDGIDDVIHAGWDYYAEMGHVTAYNGIDGSVIWTRELYGIASWCRMQAADLNLDGIPELIIPLQITRGVVALFGNDGSEYWRVERIGGSSMTSVPVICDIDGDGYPTIFAAAEDIVQPYNGELVSISHDGRILYRTFSYRPCAGGLSIADADGDGEFEIYVTDRNAGYGGWGNFTPPPAMGIHSYWAENLTLRWNVTDWLCSSHCPVLVDVNKDGILDVVTSNQRGGIGVYDSRDGSIIRRSTRLDNQYDGMLLPIHYQFSVYDIDGDGNPEMLMADGEHSNTSNDVVVWDLVEWKQDNSKRMSVGQCLYGPTVADVTGDGEMDIIVTSYYGIHIFDNEYNLLHEITGLQYRTNYAVVQDVDGDGLNEIIVSCTKGAIYVFDTPAPTPFPRARTEVFFYSEYRWGAAVYVPPP